ncbi:DUF2975 domain-containing protein [Timonella senegalensis]|uniref:DUF2975 domain-containing protein n=1 Tax=Timonella senegalensis TaxID=1465825 RepID=UPI002FDED3E3
MKTRAITTLRVVLAIALAGSAFVQFVMVPLMWMDNDPVPLAVRAPVIIILFLGVVALQVVGVCIWKLLGMVRKGTVFSEAAFKYVDIVIGAIFTGAALIFALAFTFAVSNKIQPNMEMAPGLILLIFGMSVVIAGVALVVVVMRALLAQAVRRDKEASAYKSELDEVI